MNKKRKRQLLQVYRMAFGIDAHDGVYLRHGYTPSRKRQIKKAFYRARRRGLPVLKAMTHAVLER